MDNNIFDSNNPMVALMTRAIGHSPSQPPPPPPPLQPQQPQSTTPASAMPTPTQASPGTGTGPVTTSAVEFLDAEAETALFLNSMHSSGGSINSLPSSPLPLTLPWSPSQDMIWTEDEILVGGLGIGGNGSQQSVDMTLAEDIGAEMVKMGLPGAGQGMDDGRGGVLMEEDEILPVVVVETVAVPAQQPGSPVLGFGLAQRLQHQHQHQHQQQQQQQQQQGGVRFNLAQQSNSNSGSGGNINSLNRIRSFGKVESLTPRTNSTAAFMAAAALRNGAEKGRPQPSPTAAGLLTVQRGAGARVGAEVGGGGVAQGGVAQGGATLAAAAAEEEKLGDMEIDAPEGASTSTTGSGPGLGSVQDVQSTGLRENQDTPQSSSSLLSQPIATSVLAPALELKTTEAPSESISGAHPEVAIGPGAESLAVTDTESMAQPVAAKVEVTELTTAGPTSAAEQPGSEPMVVDPAVAESDRTEHTTESIALDQPSAPQPPVTATTDVPDQSFITTTTPSSPSTLPPLSTTKPPKSRRRPPVSVQHHPSWHFAPGSDMAFLSEMKGSDADLKRFRREHGWLEERVRRPKRDHDSDLLLDRALGLTRMVVVPPLLAKGYGEVKDGEEKKMKEKDEKVVVSRRESVETQGSKDKVGGEGEKGGKDTTTTTTNNSATKAINTNTQSNNRYITPVRLSTDSRLAFSTLKTNLYVELEEQTRLETDQRILEQIVERTATKLSTTAQLHSRAEERLRELQTKQPDQERELVKMEKLERACMELRERQRQQAEEEIRQLEETVKLLESQRELTRREDVRRAERQRSEMERIASEASSTEAAH
ncbi:hypothetical protein BGX30_007723 [Mortierella sp. GBA39]|nr:hypothetical protein BGX30_007723 [Mortierella sp. GBA39]